MSEPDTADADLARRVMEVGGETVWVVRGDDHDYDAMSDWLVGVYATEAEAAIAADEDRKRYVREGGSASRANYTIEPTILSRTALKDKTNG